MTIVAVAIVSTMMITTTDALHHVRDRVHDLVQRIEIFFKSCFVYEI
jgi:cell division protein FtsL